MVDVVSSGDCGFDRLNGAEGFLKMEGALDDGTYPEEADAVLDLE